ncbi:MULTISPECIES: hypothetical protein [Pseudanabaena]|uniref:Uncharacterized protein n=2 Tax=Pseudanabaena TaxID=1152 RepID=L8N266_9CYAN|nr:MULTISPECIES: hypothetical protein [Pseudanabaena]ELS34297.1 hypothetical protein Pse7429DRAFT_0589 [Pseudanabaena biceps PCC 7429]MDG3493521.1 hypothetical protein [Pseudanabaena catenata USMAC16]
MKIKQLIIVGFSFALPISICLAPQKLQAQEVCGVNDSRQGKRGVPEYYYIPDPKRSGTGSGCSPRFGGQWHRYNGNPNSGGVFGIANTGVLLRSIYGGYSEIRPVGVVDVIPIRVSR